MTYRCPYCKADIGPSLLARCPACGKVMRVPEQNLTERLRAKRRALERIVCEHERKRAALEGWTPPAALLRSPKLYLGALVVLTLAGAALFRATDKAVGRRLTLTPAVRATRNLDVLAEALGRYRFHTGQFPGREQGLAALVRDPRVPKWNGPYINQLRADPWKTSYVYDPGTNALPVLFSCGPDQAPGTPDDLYADPARFEPGTAWTNGWVSADQRLHGVTVLAPEPAK